nr:uncharacterized protein LOC116815300 [Chelonoidis abingdonii]
MPRCPCPSHQLPPSGGLGQHQPSPPSLQPLCSEVAPLSYTDGETEAQSAQGQPITLSTHWAQLPLWHRGQGLDRDPMRSGGWTLGYRGIGGIQGAPHSPPLRSLLSISGLTPSPSVPTAHSAEGPHAGRSLPTPLGPRFTLGRPNPGIWLPRGPSSSLPAEEAGCGALTNEGRQRCQLASRWPGQMSGFLAQPGSLAMPSEDHSQTPQGQPPNIPQLPLPQERGTNAALCPSPQSMTSGTASWASVPPSPTLAGWCWVPREDTTLWG